MKKERGFTLIELLAVIIILGVLMIIAIPAVTKYINDSRKNGYISTAKEIVVGARNLIHSGSLDLNDFDTTYYIDGECIKTDNGYKSPYGDFTKAYVIVTSTNEGHDYFWLSVDSTGTGIKKITSIDKLDVDSIETDINVLDITTDKGIDGREKVVIIDSNCQKGETLPVGTRIRSDTGEKIVVCKSATTLHSTTCERTQDGCFTTIGTGNTITYGTIPNGEIKSGDAFDCDVNDDGVYDSETERFYYVVSDGANSVLIYYTSMNDQTTGPYDDSGENWHGPRTAYLLLPDKSEWKNPFLIAPGTRNIMTDSNSNTTLGGTMESFSYGNKAARLMTSQEIRTACPGGPLYSCNYFMENLSRYERQGNGSYGYWLESPRNTTVNGITRIYGPTQTIGVLEANHITSNGTRPVITIKTVYIES